MSALTVVTLALLAVAQAKYISVTVGGRDAMFIPRSVQADVGDIVTFVFAANRLGNTGNHSVVQTSFNAPCIPLENGFASPIAYYNDAAFAIEVTSADPIWFACGSTNLDHTDDHCQAGEVGAINPPSPVSLATYVGYALNAAHDGAFDALSGAGTALGTGVGASVYSWAPQPLEPYNGPYSTADAPNANPFSTPVPVYESPLPSGSGSGARTLSVGAIAGIVIGASVVLIGLLFAVWRLVVRRQRAAQTSAWAQSLGHVIARSNAVEGGAATKPVPEMVQTGNTPKETV